MVDLLGRAGQIEEAYVMITSTALEPDVVIWRAFVSACRTHKNNICVCTNLSYVEVSSSAEHSEPFNIYVSWCISARILLTWIAIFVLGYGVLVILNGLYIVLSPSCKEIWTALSMKAFKGFGHISSLLLHLPLCFGALYELPEVGYRISARPRCSSQRSSE